jgi:uncharacterized membrane protein YfcA
VILSELGNMDPLHALIAAFVVFVGGFLRGFVGFGSALVIIPVLALIFTPKLAVVVFSIMDLPVMVQLLPTAVRSFSSRTVVPMILSLLAGIPVGVYALTTIDTDIMRIVISVLVLIMVGLLALNTRMAFAAGTKASVAGGVVSGVIQGAASIGGPPVVTLLLSRGDAPDTTRANVVIMMSSLILASIPVFLAYGLMSVRFLILGGLAAPLYMLAAYLNSRYFKIGGSGIYRTVAILILGLTAISTLVLSFW